MRELYSDIIYLFTKTKTNVKYMFYIKILANGDPSRATRVKGENCRLGFIESVRER